MARWRPSVSATDRGSVLGHSSGFRPEPSAINQLFGEPGLIAFLESPFGFPAVGIQASVVPGWRDTYSRQTMIDTDTRAKHT